MLHSFYSISRFSCTLLKLVVSSLVFLAFSPFAKPDDDFSANSPKIVILGDSITAGYGLTPDEAYPALLEKLLHDAGVLCTIVNAGVSGDTTAGGLRRLPWVLQSPADFLIVALGGNDGLRATPPATTKKNLSEIITSAQKLHPDIQVILVGMMMPENLGKEFITEFHAIYPALAQEFQIPLIPFLLQDVGAIPSLNQPDGIHPNAKGQELIAKNFFSHLLPILSNLSNP